MNFNVGLIRDLVLDSMPQGSWYAGKNMVLQEKLEAVLNELGTLEITSNDLDPSYFPVGAIGFAPDIVILFLKSNNRARDNGLPVLQDQIGVLDLDARTYTPKVTTGLFSFSYSSHITGVAERNWNNELIVAFRDGVNPPRVLNLDAPPYDIDSITTFILEPEKFELTNIWPNIKPCNYYLDSVNDSGGKLNSGVYQFSICYELPGNVLTNCIGSSNMVSITDDSLYERIESYSGAEPNTFTNKSIKMRLDNLDRKFSKYHVIIVKTIGGVTSSSKIGPFPVLSEQEYFTYTGSETSDAFEVSRFLVDYLSYNKAKSVASVQGRLHWLNLENKPLIEYQKYANNIGIKWVYEDGVALPHLGAGGNVVKSTFGDPDFIFFRRMFRPGEVYTFYIRFINLDGTPGSWFHIPGREPKDISSDNETREVGTGFVSGPYAENALVSDISLDDSLWNTLLTGDEAIDDDLRWYHTRETAESTGEMGFWENRDEQYSDNQEFDGSTDYEGNAIVGGRDLRNELVRHHKFPDLRSLVAWSSNTFVDTIPALSTFVGTFILLSVSNPMYEVPYFIGVSFPYTYLFTFFTGATSTDGVEVIDGAPGIHGQIDDASGGNTKDVRFTAILPCIVDYQATNIQYNLTGNVSDVDGPDYAYATFNTKLVHYNSSGAVLGTYGENSGSDIDHTLAFNLTSSPHSFGALISMSTGDYLVLEGRTTIELYSGVLSGIVATCSGSVTGRVIEVTKFALEGNRATKCLGISVENIFIPEEIKKCTSGFEIGYAERTIDNMTVVGMSALNHFNYMTTGPVFSNDILSGEQVRLHPFELLQRQALSPITHLKNQLLFTGLTFPGFPHPYKERDYVENSLTTFTEGHTNHGNQFILPLKDVRTIARGVDTTISGTAVDNTESESCIYGVTRALDITYLTPTEDRYLSDLCIYRRNVYQRFQDQQNIIPTCKIFFYGNEDEETLAIDKLYGGDTFVVPSAIRMNKPNDGSWTIFLGNDVGLDIVDIYPVFCSDNQLLRHEGIGDFETFYPIYGGTSGITGDWLFKLSSLYVTPGDEAAAWADAITQLDWRGYNDDYTKLQRFSKSLPFDEEAIAPYKYPYRIIRSGVISRETGLLGWYEYPPLDYVELIRTKGEGMVLMEHDDQLLIIMRYTTLRTRPLGRLNTGTAEDVTLGRGDLFEFDPTEIITTTGGYIGTQSQYGVRHTKAGIVIIDGYARKIFIIGNSADEITNKGNRQWFLDNFSLEINDQMFAVDPTAQFDCNEVSIWGVGYSAAFDEEANRIMISKKDFRLTDPSQFKGTHDPDNPGFSGFYFYNGELGKVISSLDPIILVDILDGWTSAGIFYALAPVSKLTSGIEDRSITMSYSLAKGDGVWAFYHDWLPDFTVGTRDKFLSYSQRKPYLHHFGPVGNFYGITYPSYIEPIFSTQQEMYWLSIEFLAKIFSGKRVLSNKTLSQIIAYSSRQCSGVVNLGKSTFTDPGVHIVDGISRFDGFSDIAVHDADGEVSAFFDDRDNFLPASVNSRTSWHNRKRFIDNWFGVRLIHNNVDGNRLYLYTIDVSARPAAR
jgi:hypothetical protein